MGWKHSFVVYRYLRLPISSIGTLHMYGFAQRSDQGHGIYFRPIEYTKIRAITQ